MKLFQGQFHIDSIELIFFKKFPVDHELKYIHLQDIQEIIYHCIKNENYYIYHINNNYFYTSLLTNLNHKNLQPIYIVHVPNLYIIDDHLYPVVNILNLSKFEIETNYIDENEYDIIIYLQKIKPNYELIDTKHIYTSFDRLQEIDFTDYDLILKNSVSSFIGINENYKIINQEGNDVTNATLQLLFVLLKTLCIIMKYYKTKNISLIQNPNLDDCDKIELKDLLNYNLTKINLETVFYWIESIQKS